MKPFSFFLLSLFLVNVGKSQGIHHWETAIYNTDEWRFFIGEQEPPANWNSIQFSDDEWQEGKGSIGYSDNDDNTIIDPTLSVYLRKTVSIQDLNDIADILFHADYDDAFVAYLNGEEIARANIGEQGIPPKHNEKADTWREAQLYQGGEPESYSIPLSKLIKGKNVLAIQVHNKSLTSSDLSGHFFLSFGINTAKKLFRPTPSWFEAPFSSSNLPLMVITTEEDQEIQDEPRIVSHLGIIDNGQKRNFITDSFNGYDGKIAIEIRGASSQGFPKKNYGFETQLENGDNNNVSLLGMPSENDWVLHGPYTDKTLIRNALAYYMGRSTGRYAPRTRFCELVVNDDYRGVYILTERIKRDKNRVDIANLKEDDIAGDELTGGYILQIDRDDESTTEDGWTSKYPEYKFFAYDDPDWDDLLPVQKNYIRRYMDSFESAMDGSNYLNQYNKYVDVESWVDYFLVTEIGKHIDAYKLSFFMHKKKDSNGGKIHFGPLWDFNLGFGNFDFACSPDPEGWSYLFVDDCSKWLPFWSKKLTNIPEVSNQINCRWDELRAGPLHTDSLLAFINTNTDYLQEAQIRNFKRWPVLGSYVWPNDFVGDTYEEETTFIKNWLTQRLSWMDANMLGDCESLVDAPHQYLPKEVKVYPNPARDKINVQFSETPNSSSLLSVYDLLGNKLLETKVDQAKTSVSINHLPQGLYVYSLSRDNKTLMHGRLQVMK
jgi:hypothetical protein